MSSYVLSLDNGPALATKKVSTVRHYSSYTLVHRAKSRWAPLSLKSVSYSSEENSEVLICISFHGHRAKVMGDEIIQPPGPDESKRNDDADLSGSASSLGSSWRGKA